MHSLAIDPLMQTGDLERFCRVDPQPAMAGLRKSGLMLSALVLLQSLDEGDLQPRMHADEPAPQHRDHHHRVQADQ